MAPKRPKGPKAPPSSPPPAAPTPSGRAVHAGIWILSAAALILAQWSAVGVLFLDQQEQFLPATSAKPGPGGLPPGKYPGEWRFLNDGLAIASGKQSQAQWQFFKKPEEGLLIRFRAPMPEGMRYALLAGSKEKQASIQSKMFETPRWVDFSGSTLGESNVVVFLQASFESKTEDVGTVIQDLEIKKSILTPGRMKRISGLPGLVALIPLLYWMLGALGISEIPRRGWTTAFAVALTVFSSIAPALAVTGVYAFGVALVISAALLARKKPEALRVLGHWAVLGFGMLLIHIRWSQTAGVFGSQLDLAPDANALIGILGQSLGPFDTGFHEPLYLWLVWLARAVLGRSALAAQFLNAGLGALSLALAWLVGRRLGGPLVGLGGMAILGLCPQVALQGARGQGEDAFIAAVLALALAIDARPRAASWARAIVAGAAAGAVCLLQIAATPLCLLFFVWFGVRKRWQPVRLAAAVLTLCVAVLPHLLNNHRVSGDWLYSANYHARFYRNLEFGGQPDYPSKDEIARDAYAGPDVKMRDYIFGEHSLGVVAKRFAQGLWESLAGVHALYTVFDGNAFLFCVYVGGFLAAAIRKRWTLLAIPLVLAAPMAFFAQNTTAFDPRLLLHLAPWLGFLMGMGMEGIRLMFPLTLPALPWLPGLAPPGRQASPPRTR